MAGTMDAVMWLVVMTLSPRVSATSSESSPGRYFSPRRNKLRFDTKKLWALPGDLSRFRRASRVLHPVTTVVPHNPNNASRFRGNGRYALLQFQLYLQATCQRETNREGVLVYTVNCVRRQAYQGYSQAIHEQTVRPLRELIFAFHGF